MNPEGTQEKKTKGEGVRLEKMFFSYPFAMASTFFACVYHEQIMPELWQQIATAIPGVFVIGMLGAGAEIRSKGLLNMYDGMSSEEVEATKKERSRSSDLVSMIGSAKAVGLSTVTGVVGYVYSSKVIEVIGDLTSRLF